MKRIFLFALVMLGAFAASASATTPLLAAAPCNANLSELCAPRDFVLVSNTANMSAWQGVYIRFSLNSTSNRTEVVYANSSGYKQTLATDAFSEAAAKPAMLLSATEGATRFLDAIYDSTRNKIYIAYARIFAGQPVTSQFTKVISYDVASTSVSTVDTSLSANVQTFNAVHSGVAMLNFNATAYLMATIFQNTKSSETTTGTRAYLRIYDKDTNAVVASSNNLLADTTRAISSIYDNTTEFTLFYGKGTPTMSSSYARFSRTSLGAIASDLNAYDAIGLNDFGAYTASGSRALLSTAKDGNNELYSLDIYAGSTTRLTATSQSEILQGAKPLAGSTYAAYYYDPIGNTTRWAYYCLTTDLFDVACAPDVGLITPLGNAPNRPVNVLMTVQDVDYCGSEECNFFAVLPDDWLKIQYFVDGAFATPNVSIRNISSPTSPALYNASCDVYAQNGSFFGRASYVPPTDRIGEAWELNVHGEVGKYITANCYLKRLTGGVNVTLTNSSLNSTFFVQGTRLYYENPLYDFEYGLGLKNGLNLQNVVYNDQTATTASASAVRANAKFTQTMYDSFGGRQFAHYEDTYGYTCTSNSTKLGWTNKVGDVFDGSSLVLVNTPHPWVTTYWNYQGAISPLVAGANEYFRYATECHSTSTRIASVAQSRSAFLLAVNDSAPSTRVVASTQTQDSPYYYPSQIGFIADYSAQETATSQYTREIGGAACSLNISGVTVNASANNPYKAYGFDKTGLVAWWDLGDSSLNETSAGVSRDWSGNFANLTIPLAAQVSSEGIIGNSLNFTSSVAGGQAYIAPIASIETISTAFTVTAWVKRNGTATNGAFTGIVSHSASNNIADGFGLYFRNVDGEYCLALSGETDRVCTIGALPTGWIHLAGTYNAGSATIYLNGVAHESKGTATFVDAIATTYVGRLYDSDATKMNWAGKIDDVKLFNRSLSLGEIGSLYSNGCPTCDYGVEANVSYVPTTSTFYTNGSYQLYPLQNLAGGRYTYFLTDPLPIGNYTLAASCSKNGYTSATSAASRFEVAASGGLGTSASCTPKGKACVQVSQNCPDGFNATCRAMCFNAQCLNTCQPDCTGHGAVSVVLSTQRGQVPVSDFSCPIGDATLDLLVKAEVINSTTKARTIAGNCYLDILESDDYRYYYRTVPMTTSSSDKMFYWGNDGTGDFNDIRTAMQCGRNYIIFATCTSGIPFLDGTASTTFRIFDSASCSDGTRAGSCNQDTGFYCNENLQLVSKPVTCGRQGVNATQQVKVDKCLDGKGNNKDGCLVKYYAGFFSDPAGVKLNFTSNASAGTAYTCTLQRADAEVKRNSPMKLGDKNPVIVGGKLINSNEDTKYYQLRDVVFSMGSQVNLPLTAEDFTANPDGSLHLLEQFKPTEVFRKFTVNGSHTEELTYWDVFQPYAQRLVLGQHLMTETNGAGLMPSVFNTTVAIYMRCLNASSLSSAPKEYVFYMQGDVGNRLTESIFSFKNLMLAAFAIVFLAILLVAVGRSGLLGNRQG